MLKEAKPAAQKEAAFSGISVRSFITVVAILLLILFFCGSLSYLIPQGTFARDAENNIILDTYEAGSIEGIAPWRVITAPFRVFASADAVTIIMISLFLLIMSGIFNILEKTGGIKIFIVHIMNRLRDKGGPVVCVTVLIFMLFGSLFGMFEELVTLLPLIIVIMLSMKMDTMVGLGSCLLAACFGFSTAITNPFSIGTAAQYAGIPTSSGAWLRIVFFVIVYVILCVFLMGYLKKLLGDPMASPTYAADQKRRRELVTEMGDIRKPAKGFPCLHGVFWHPGIGAAFDCQHPPNCRLCDPDIGSQLLAFWHCFRISCLQELPPGARLLFQRGSGNASCCADDCHCIFR